MDRTTEFPAASPNTISFVPFREKARAWLVLVGQQSALVPFSPSTLTRLDASPPQAAAHLSDPDAPLPAGVSSADLRVVTGRDKKRRRKASPLGPTPPGLNPPPLKRPRTVTSPRLETPTPSMSRDATVPAPVPQVPPRVETPAPVPAASRVETPAPTRPASPPRALTPIRPPSREVTPLAKVPVKGKGRTLPSDVESSKPPKARVSQKKELLAFQAQWRERCAALPASFHGAAPPIPLGLSQVQDLRQEQNILVS